MANPGDKIKLAVTASGTIVNSDNVPRDFITVPNAAVLWASVTSTNPKRNYSRTFVDDNNILHLGENLEAGDVVSVNGHLAYINPSNDDEKNFLKLTAFTVEIGE